jgi:nucleotide-binding universal stress UspA family protein
MAGWKKICCAVDFSEVSQAALVEAADLARRLDAELVLLHIHDPPPIAADGMGSPAELKVAARELHRRLDVFKSEAERIANRPVRAAVFGGSPPAEIVRFACANGCDAIVLGTHGRAGLSRLVLGSVADRVARGARCAVVLVHREARRGDVATAAAA